VVNTEDRQWQRRSRLQSAVGIVNVDLVFAQPQCCAAQFTPGHVKTNRGASEAPALLGSPYAKVITQACDPGHSNAYIPSLKSRTNLQARELPGLPDQEVTHYEH